MAGPRRLQHRSCDQCRKGKRGCDATFRRELLSKETQTPTSSSPSSSTSTGRSTDHTHNATTVEPCSNCKRWRRDCTFHWLKSVQNRKRSPKRSRKDDPSKDSEPVRRHIAAVHDVCINGPAASSNLSSVPQLDTPADDQPFMLLQDDDPFGTVSSCWGDDDVEPKLSNVTKRDLDLGHTGNVPYRPEISPGNDGSYASSLAFDDLEDWFFSQDDPITTDPKAYSMGTPTTPFATTQIQDFSLGQTNYTASCAQRSYVTNMNDCVFVPWDSSGENRYCNFKSRVPSQPIAETQFSLSSQKFVDDFLRSVTARNLLRVYHDSIENALTCWLTERNCPYSSVNRSKYRPTASLQSRISVDGEWGPNWSNRICARVCRLDRAYSTVRGRALTSTEERTASRALHASIMAFAAQWSPDSISRSRISVHRSFSGNLNTYSSSTNTDMGGPMSYQETAPSLPNEGYERSVQDTLWNEALQILNEAASTESFRVVFAHIIFSITQKPLDVNKYAYYVESLGCGGASDHRKVHDLFDGDPAPLFLEKAVRQMFSCRYKISRLQRQSNNPSMRTHRDSSGAGSRVFLPFSGGDDTDRENSPLKSRFLSAEDHETFNLLFWLGIMFDTLTAAMYQRPLVVSDEDSEINCADSPDAQLAARIGECDDIDLDGWSLDSPNVPNSKMNVWGDLFLQRAIFGNAIHNIARWPCSYEEAAETLSDAAPVKVLLFRRVTRLQTLVYRNSSPERLEEAIRDTFRVYHCWNHTYGVFMRDCITHHENLPPRIQSWYVLLAGHWHLAAIILADTIDSIDNAQIGLDSERDLRRSANLVSKLKIENALAISNLAQSSLESGGDGSFTKAREFHDAVSDGAILTEPWTAVLIRAFSRAGYILLDKTYQLTSASIPVPVDALPNISDGDTRRRCAYCINALWSLGKKSDMAFVAARTLSHSLQEMMRTPPQHV